MTSPGAKGEKEVAMADSTAAVPPEEKSGGGGKAPPPPPSSSSSSSLGTSKAGTTTTPTAPLGPKSTDTGSTSPGEVSGQDTAQDTDRIEAGGPAKTSGSTNEKRRSSSEEAAHVADARRRTVRRTTSSTSESPRRPNDEDVPDPTGDDTIRQPQEEKQDDDDERIRHEMDSNQHGEARLLPHKFKRRKVAAIDAAAVAVNEAVQDASTSITACASVPGEGMTPTTRTTATSSTSNNAETSSSSSSSMTTSGVEGILASSSQTEDNSAISTAHATSTATYPATTSLSAEIGILVAQAEQAAKEAAHSSSSAAASGVVGAAAIDVAATGRLGQAQTHPQAEAQGQTQGRDLESSQLPQPQHGVASSSSSAAVSAAQAPAAAPAPAIPLNSTAEQYQQMQALVAQRREQLAAALQTHQQLSAVASASTSAHADSLARLGDLSGPAASAIGLGLGLGALGTIGTGTSQASINAAAANLAAARAHLQARVQAQADAALGISSHPLVGNLSVDSALRSYLMETTTAGTGGRAGGLLGTVLGQASANIPSYYDPISSSPNRTRLSQFGSPAYHPLSTGLDLTTVATNAMLQHQADLEYLLQLRAQRSLLSSISATAAAGLSPNDTATSILARLQAGTPGAGASTVSASSSSVGFPSAASVASPSPAAAQSQGRVLGQGTAQIQGGTQGPSIISRGDESRLSKAPPLPNITPTAAEAPADQRITRCDGVVCLSSGLPHFTNRTIVPLSAPDDVHWLSNYLCFVREKCVEVFEANDAKMSWRNNAKIINPRQVGIRCRYCAHIHQRDRAGRSTSFPSSLSRIYQSLTMMLREHFPTCTEMPPAIKERFLTLKGQTTPGFASDKRRLKSSDVSAKESRSYWVDSAKDIGLYDTELGIKRRTPPARAIQDSTLPSSGQGP